MADNTRVTHDRFAGLTRTIVAPSRRRKYVAQSLSERQPGLKSVARNSHILMEEDLDGVVGFNVLDQSVYGRIRGFFGYKRSEKSVPDNERTGIVRVEIPGIGAVMHAVMRGGVKDRFEPARHLLDGFGVQEELIGGIEHAAEGYQQRIETDQHQRDLQQHRPCEVLDR